MEIWWVFPISLQKCTHNIRNNFNTSIKTMSLEIMTFYYQNIQMCCKTDMVMKRRLSVQLVCKVK